MNKDINQKLQALYQAYTQNLPAKLAAIVQGWAALNEHWQLEALRNFHREIHSLCGSAAIYGYEDLSHAARELEIYLKALDDAAAGQTPAIVADVSRLLNKIMAQAAPQPAAANAVLPSAVIPLAAPVVTASVMPQLYLIAKNIPAANDLQQDCNAAGFGLQVFPDVTSFSKSHPEAVNYTQGVILIGNLPAVTPPELQSLLHFRNTDLLIIFLSDEDDKVMQLMPLNLVGKEHATPKTLPKHLLSAVHGRIKSNN